MGTSVGTQVFVKNGWRATAGVSMAWYAFQLAVLLARGPHVPRCDWVGWKGGWEARKSVLVMGMGASASGGDPEPFTGQTAMDEKYSEADVKDPHRAIERDESGDIAREV